MECNIYAHHQIKTVFLYFLLGENGIKQQFQHKIFFQQLPMIKEAKSELVLSFKRGLWEHCRTFLKLKSQIWKNFLNGIGQNCIYIYLQL